MKNKAVWAPLHTASVTESLRFTDRIKSYLSDAYTHPENVFRFVYSSDYSHSQLEREHKRHIQTSMTSLYACTPSSVNSKFTITWQCSHAIQRSQVFEPTLLNMLICLNQNENDHPFYSVIQSTSLVVSYNRQLYTTKLKYYGKIFRKTSFFQSILYCLWMEPILEQLHLDHVPIPQHNK